MGKIKVITKKNKRITPLIAVIGASLSSAALVSASPIEIYKADSKLNTSGSLIGEGSFVITGNVAYIRPVAAGGADGTSWANAAAITQLNNFIAPGRTIYIRADEGLYDMSTTGFGPVTLTAGGTANNALIVTGTDGEGITCELVNLALSWNPCTIIGVDVNLTPMHAVFQGGRRLPGGVLWVLPSDPEQVTNVNVTGFNIGGACIRLAAGADNLKFSHLNMTHFGEPGAFVINALTNHVNIELDNCLGYDCRRWWEHESSPSTGINGFYVHGTGTDDMIGHSKTAIRIRGISTHCLFVDFDINSGRQANDNFPECFEMNETANHTTFRRCKGRNVSAKTQSADPNNTTFWNGDGFSGERGNDNCTYIDCESYGHTDAGLDSKGLGYVKRFIGGDSKHNIKCWGQFTFDDCQVLDSHKRGGSDSLSIIQVEQGANLFFNRLASTQTGGKALCEIDTAVSPTPPGNATFTDITRLDPVFGFNFVNHGGGIIIVDGVQVSP